MDSVRRSIVSQLVSYFVQRETLGSDIKINGKVTDCVPSGHTQSLSRSQSICRSAHIITQFNIESESNSIFF